MAADFGYETPNCCFTLQGSRTQKSNIAVPRCIITLYLALKTSCHQSRLTLQNEGHLELFCFPESEENMLPIQTLKKKKKNGNEACFKRRATAVLSLLDCS